MVYVLTLTESQDVTLDMFGSSYDTKIWIWNEALDLIACNDDYYADYTSRIDEVYLEADVTYYVIIDGYGGDHGEYLLEVFAHEPCVLDCPIGAELEGEPPLVDGYVDLFNGGCNTDLAAPPFQPITAPIFCGVSGWYLDPDGDNFRDTDWFVIDLPASGVLEITGDAEEQTYMFELGPQDCETVGVVQNVTIGDCQENSMTITGEPHATIWFWVGPTTYTGPHGEDVLEYDYVLWTNLSPVATETRSWTAVKTLFD